MSLLTDLMERFENGTLNETVTEVRFVHKNRSQASAMGQLVCVNGQLELKLHGKVKFRRDIEQDLIALSNEIEIEGELAGGVKFEGKPRTFVSFDYFLHPSWQQTLQFSELTFENNSSTKSPNSSYSGYLCAFPQGLTEKPLIQKSGKSKEIHLFQYSEHGVDLRLEEREFGHFCQIDCKKAQADDLLTIGALIFTLGFFMGRWCRWKSRLARTSGKEQLRLLSKVNDYNGFFIPLRLHNLGYAKKEKVFKTVFEFFYNNSSNILVRMLRMLWLTPDFDFEAKALLLAVAVEGLASSNFIEDKNKQIELRAFKRRIQKAIKNIDDSRLKGNDLERLSGIVEKFNPSSTRVIFESAFAKVGHKLTDTEFDVWRETRNQRAHGGFSVNAPTGADHDNFFKCVDLFHEFCFCLIGLKGIVQPLRHFHPRPTDKRVKHR